MKTRPGDRNDNSPPGCQRGDPRVQVACQPGGLGGDGEGGFIRSEATASSDHFRPCTVLNGADDCNEGEELNEVYDLPTKIIPWVNFLFGLRFKPHRHVAIYADAGFGIGFQTGLRAEYIF